MIPCLILPPTKSTVLTINGQTKCGRRCSWEVTGSAGIVHKMHRTGTQRPILGVEQTMSNPTTGELCATPSEVNECWNRHYESLTQDPHPIDTRK